MTTTFTGEVRIPGSIENGLPSTITLDPQTVILTAGGTELGRWNRTDLVVSREPDGAFRLALGREIVLFNPDSPLEFAILSGMPGAATAPAPTATPPVTAPPLEAAPPAVAPPPEAAPAVAAAPPVAAVPPVAATPPPSAPTTAPPAPAPPPAIVPPSAATPPPAAPTPPPVVAPEAMPDPQPADPIEPPPAAATPPPVAPQAASAPSPPTVPTAPPIVPEPHPAPPPGQTSGLPPAPPAAAAAVAAAASVAAAPTQPGPVEIRLETDSGVAPAPAAPVQETPPPAAPAQETPPSAGSVAETPPAGSGDFWDGFHEEEREAGVQPLVAPEAAAAAAAPAIQLEAPDDAVAEESRVGGWGSGLFTEGDDGEPAYPPAFRGSDETVEGEDRDWSFYKDGGEDGDEDGVEDRGWSYDDPKPEEPTKDEEPPAFKSPAADRDDLVEKSSRLRDAAAWRPSLPTFSLGGSSLGMRARGVLEVLDAVLEENGTEDIPRSFLFGLLGLVGVLALIALIAFIF